MAKAKNKEDYFWSNSPRGGHKMLYSDLEKSKKKLTPRQKIWWIIGILLVISYFILIAIMSK